MQTTDYVSTLFEGRNNPEKVTVAFTMAVQALKKGYSATLILMVNAVELGRPGATEGLDIGKPFEPVPALLDSFVALGGRVAVCSSCMIHNGMQPEDIAPGYEIITGADVVDLLMAARGSL